MNELGLITLFLAWGLSLIGGIFGFSSGNKSSKNLFEYARIFLLATTFFTISSLIVLSYLFYTDDYANQYVWQFSSKEMSSVYKITAVWGGMDGSMLLWAGILSIGAGILGLGSRALPFPLSGYILGCLNFSILFFLSVTLFLTNPFRYIQSEIIPADGNGLNPLLQNPYMAIHPPIMYVGLTWFAIPAAIAFAVLLTKEAPKDWYALCRKWTLLAWGFLTVGKVLGGYWAYIELGWGGFWAWDPVENSSFIPWLTGTALLHSVMAQEKKGMLKLWNIWLALITYALTVFGTFLTRSGVVQSVHAFASTDIGWVFLLYLSFFILSAIYFTFKKHNDLKSERHIESFFSREAALLINNLILLSISFATLWGVLFPVLSEAITGTKQTVGIPYFNTVNVPLFLLMVFFMGVGPLIAWNKTSFYQLKKQFLQPLVTACIVACMLVWAGVPGFYPILSYALCTFVFMTILSEVYRIKKSHTSHGDEKKTFRKFQKTLGAHIVHLGVLTCVVGITASMAHKMEREFTLSQGQSMTVGAFTLTLKELSVYQTSSFEALRAVTEVFDSTTKAHVSEVFPESRYYFKKKENTSEVSIFKSWKGDLYVVLAGLDDSGTKAAMKIFINPLQSLLWLGTCIMMIGLGVLLIPTRKA